MRHLQNTVNLQTLIRQLLLVIMCHVGKHLCKIRDVDFKGTPWHDNIALDLLLHFIQLTKCVD